MANKEYQNLSRQEANKLIAENIAKAQKLIDECEEIADATDVSFHIEFGGYGSGASYTPRSPRAEGEEDWESSSEGWLASSQSC